MNRLRNKVQLIGNLGQDVQYRKLDNGSALARASLATKEVYTNAEGEKVIDTQWHNIIAWGKTADIMQVLFQKGKEVAIEGKLTHRSYEDKQGKKRHRSEVVVNEFLLIN